MKQYILIFAAIAAFILSAYYAGGRVAAEKCRAEFAARSVAATQKINETKRKINAETFNTSTAVIRNSLRAKYTIAE